MVGVWRILNSAAMSFNKLLTTHRVLVPILRTRVDFFSTLNNADCEGTTCAATAGSGS